VYSDEKNYESLHPYTTLTPELATLSRGPLSAASLLLCLA